MSAGRTAPVTLFWLVAGSLPPRALVGANRLTGPSAGEQLRCADPQSAWSNRLCRRRYLSFRVATKGRSWFLEDGMMGLGRDSSNFIQVHDTEVSRRHAEIRREGDAFTVVDLGSSNGTFVNGERVERHALANGDRLQVGSTLILFTDPGDVPEDLSDKIDIVMRSHASDNSRIVRSMSQEEGSAMFHEPLAPARGARLDHAAQQPANHVSHDAGRQPHAGHRPTADPDHAVDFRLGRGRPRLRHADERREQAARTQGPSPPSRHRHRRKAGHQPHDSGPCHPERRGSADQRRPRRRPLDPGRQHFEDGRTRSDLRADAGTLRHGRRDLHRHLAHPAKHRPAGGDTEVSPTNI